MDERCRVSTPQPYQLDNAVARLAARQWGVVSLDELRACGLKKPAISVRVRNGRLHRLHRGVYAVGHASPPLLGRFLAAVKACGPTAVLSHLSAAAVHDIITWEERYPEVTVPGTTTRTHAGIRVHRTTLLDARDVTRKGPLPLTSPTRTLVDLSATLSDQALRRAVRQAQALRLVRAADLAATKLRHLVAAGPAPTRSELEDVVLDLILGGGLAPPDVNTALHLAGRRIVPDFRWPAQRVIVEADGAAYHDNPIARRDDQERQALLEAHGERVIRVTWQEATRQPAQTLERLRAAGAPSSSPARR